MSKKYKYKKNIKIIGGKYGGQFLNSVHHLKVRPTNSQIKETLFNWLQKFIYNSTCLDCFSGSGNLSIESASRFAASVTSLEKNKKLFTNIQNTLHKLQIQNVHLKCVNTLKWLKKLGTPYDIIYLDPPFQKTKLLHNSIILLNKNNWIKKNSLIYIEKNKNFKNLKIPNNWKCIKNKNTGQVSYSLYKIKNI
ncbi:16S rRNA (guanine(966)-N(2))-methyltransferase RsmD [Buchnera aphidicola]|uniref:Ribosomal RNA small subunit methyltransferase D n=1 Tax=Buchnera aphidicola subsp. Tuberolachnus salignus TaxID=98804 RepID=A0A160SXT8_BUCTT|nr:16S rRNA (guanine(966)-N(2))-methyltransferase RsmD [Buchnera aphidicola]CUR53004.1 Ribosomal RNA small subunit methyltransferase D [Buchnera aphidicola (Tuberolachnus salignus)]